MNSQTPSLTRAAGLDKPFFEKQAQDGQARAGRLALAHGQVLTPIFMPVGTYGAVKGATCCAARVPRGTMSCGC